MSSIKGEIVREVDAIYKKQVEWRRNFHTYPELSFEEFKTTASITGIVKKLGLKILPVKSPTGALAELTGKCPGPTIAIRTDIDALPIDEQTSLAYKSKNAGCMHACGHDMHMAVVLGTAAVLSKLKQHLHGKVRFIFQPAEEMPPGGARPMIANHALKNVSMIFGLHVDPHLPTGSISLRDGVTMASVTDFDIIVHGKSGHAASPHKTVDAIVTAAEVIESIQKVVSRDINPVEPVVVTFGKIKGGTARNVISDRVTITGTARTLSDKIGRKVLGAIKRTTQGICKARGAGFEFNIVAGYPVLKNHPKANKILARNFRMLFNKEKIETTKQILGGEDFACYLKEVPGAMFRLGIMNKKIGAFRSWHSTKFIADERSLPVGTALLTAAVIDILAVEKR